MRRLIFFALVIILLTAGCGYHNPYAPDSDREPISIHRSMWKNQTTELGLETVIYHSLSNWLRNSNLIRIKEVDETAQYKLTGEITATDYPEISYGTNNIATELRINLTVHYQLTDVNNANILIETTKTFPETFIQGATPAKTQINRDIALAEIAENISEEIYKRLINQVLRK